jgi:hypothetical protein
MYNITGLFYTTLGSLGEGSLVCKKASEGQSAYLSCPSGVIGQVRAWRVDMGWMLWYAESNPMSSSAFTRGVSSGFDIWTGSPLPWLHTLHDAASGGGVIRPAQR